tara:strand:- start:740 stop:967 length:228 start_codon:yes stop_codon:yes gene_type:complete
MKTKCNFVAKLNPKMASKKSVEECNNILIKKFLRKWKQSGILKELRDRKEPMTRGQKARKKRYLGKRRNNNKVNR